jgi:hypothetical protein
MKRKSSSTVTLGLVQKEIKPGLPQSDVAAVLGSPNIVTSDSQSRETWIYDKVASEVSYSKSEGGISALLFGAGGSGGRSRGSSLRLADVLARL